MVDLKAFRKYNKLSQKDVAKFLGVSRSFIGQVESGFSKLPSDKLDDLLRNKQGWDISMLVVKDNEADVESLAHVGTNSKSEIILLQKHLAALKAENDLLRAQNAKYWAMIERLTGK